MCGRQIHEDSCYYTRGGSRGEYRAHSPPPPVQKVSSSNLYMHDTNYTYLWNAAETAEVELVATCLLDASYIVKSAL